MTMLETMKKEVERVRKKVNLTGVGILRLRLLML